MKYSDAELRDASQVAYQDFSREIERLNKNPNISPPYTIEQLCEARGGSVSSVFPDMDSSRVAKWTIVDYYDTNSTTGFYGCLIETEPGNAIIAFRGSEGMEKDMSNLQHDWIEADLGLLNSDMTSQHKEVEKFLDQIANSDYASRYDFIATTGHSLGGNLAMHATVVSSEQGLSDKIQQCVSYDGPGFSGEYISKYRNQIAKESDKMTHFQWSLVGKMLSPLPGVERTKLKYNADDTMTKIIGRHDMNSLEFDHEGNAIRNPNGPQGWEYLDEFCEKFSKGLDHLPSFVGNSVVFVVSRLLYAGIWMYNHLYDENHNLSPYAVNLITAGIALILFNPSLTIALVASLVVYVTVFVAAVLLYELVYEMVEKIVSIIVEAAVTFYHMVAQAAEQFRAFVAERLRELREWWNSTFNQGYRYSCQHPWIQVDTDKMQQYASVLRQINSKLSEIDRRMDSLYRSLRLGDKARLMRADVLTGYSLRLGMCASYLEDTAAEFSALETKLIKLM